MLFRSKRVFHIITTISRGGAENQLLVLCKAQIMNGFDVNVIYLKDEPELQENFEEIGVRVISNLAGKKFYVQPFILARLKGIKDSIVHAHLPRAELIAFFTLVKFTLIISRHNAEPFFPGAPSFLSSCLSKMVSIRAKKIITISQAVFDAIINYREIINKKKLTVEIGRAHV